MKSIKRNLTVIVIILVFMIIPLVSAGFASSYLPTVDGKQVLQGTAEQTYSYYIYLQNLESQSVVIKIEILEGNSMITNTISNEYTVPANTQSDSFPVELKIKVPSGAIGTLYKLKYSVISSTINGSGMIVFDPVGFDKTIYIKVAQEVTNNPVTTTTSGSETLRNTHDSESSDDQKDTYNSDDVILSNEDTDIPIWVLYLGGSIVLIIIYLIFHSLEHTEMKKFRLKQKPITQKNK